MQTFSFMHFSKLPLAVVVFGVSLSFGCQNKMFQSEPPAPPEMKTVPSVRLNYRYEPDVPVPSIDSSRAEDRNLEVQADFDKNRPVDELLERTIASPDKKYVLAVYRNIADVMAEYRLDMYSVDGKLQKRITSDAMAVHFPDSIVWSPDSTSFAFVAMTRADKLDGDGFAPSPVPAATQSSADSNSIAPVDETEKESNKASAAPTPAAPTGILTFRTEQIYICSADGSGLKPITENEGLIYFYYAWSPDSSMLAALATTAREWNYLDFSASHRDPPELMVPLGRLRIIEKNGRERRLDDNLTAVHPVWSPDSSKVAIAFETQVRIYDAEGTNPTQAAIPLRNQLLISSQAYDRDQQRQTSSSDANAPANTAASTGQPPSTLPDEKLLVSYNPIVELLWAENEMIYLKTAYIKRMKNVADNVTSFARWHRLPLSVQPAAPTK